jgi:iron(III) transport system substrate-binding protein
MAGMGGLLLPRAVLADTPALAEAARGEGTLTWYVSQLDAEEAESLGRTFTEAHPGVKVMVIRATGQVIFQRLLLDIKNQTPNCDVFSTSDISHMPILKDRRALTRFVPANAAGLAPPFKALSDDGWYYVTNAGRYFMIHNTNKVAPADAPKKWTDLLDPKWKNQLAVAHPAFSGGTSVWVLTLRKRFGWSYFEALAKNNPRIGRSAVDPVTLLSGGECSVAATWGPAAYRALDKGNPLAVDHPADGTVALAFPSGIPAHAPHPNAARLFMEWLLSEQYSRLIAADGSEPLRADVAGRAGSPRMDDGSVISLTVDEIRKGVPEVIEQWRDTFGV